MTQTFGRYEIIRELGRGGMATVHLAEDPYMKREVAVKVITSQLAKDQSFIQRFKQEAEVIASLEHPAIVPIYDFGREGEDYYIVMRYMPNGTLGERIPANGMDMRELVPIIEHVASGLDEAHKQNVVHRDVKPANILFSMQDQGMLTDFGLAKVAAEQDLSMAGSMIGTTAYMAPEQVLGQDVDGRTDVYGLGVVIFQIMTGQLPFDEGNPIATAMAHLHKPVPSAQALMKTRRRMPIDDVFAKALAKDKADRYHTAGELAQEIKGLLSGRFYLNKLLDE